MIDLNNIMRYHENNRIEAKKAAGGFPHSLWETYSAFANTVGGLILLGVEESRDKQLRVTGVPDPVRGKAVKATVVLADGFRGSDELTRELQKWVKKKTAPYKYPRIVEYVDELPKTVNGKIRRAAIREANKQE